MQRNIPEWSKDKVLGKSCKFKKRKRKKERIRAEKDIYHRSSACAGKRSEVGAPAKEDDPKMMAIIWGMSENKEK